MWFRKTLLPRPCPSFSLGLLVLTFISSHVCAAELEFREFRVISPGQAHLTLDTPSDLSLEIQSTSNLTDWGAAGPFATVSSDQVTTTFFVNVNESRDRELFRVVYRPVIPPRAPLAVVVGPGTEAVIPHLPAMEIVPEDASDLTIENGVPISLAHILVTLKQTTTIDQLNALLSAEELVISGTIPAMHVLMLRRSEVTSLEDIVAQESRLESSGLFTTVSLNLGSVSSYDEQTPVPQLNRIYPEEPQVDWTWEVLELGMGSGGNNAFEMSRIPQLWNWLDYGYRQKMSNVGHDVVVMELAFNQHGDLLPNYVHLAQANTPGSTLDHASHGTGVIGVVAASHDSVGIQGVTPLANRVLGVAFDSTESGYIAFEADILQQLCGILTNASSPNVISISAGANYQSPPPSQFLKDAMDKAGETWANAFDNLYDSIEHDYLIVTSAGNHGGIDARYGSPRANIACRPNLLQLAPNFLVVENVRGDRTPYIDETNGSNYDVSGEGHAVSAGGTDVWLLSGPGNSNYDIDRGTSFATPFVAGLASYLWSLEPSLSVFELKSVLMNTNTTFTVADGNRAPLVDGFASALAIDLLLATNRLQKALVDVDDGTRDGSLRQEVISWSEDSNKIHTQDGRRGDGKVNMRDLRTFRDAWIQVSGLDNALDGESNHFKRDLNFDGQVFGEPVFPSHPVPYNIPPQTGSPMLEMIYSRYDFNGNGYQDQDTHIWKPDPENISPFKVDPDTPVVGQDIRKGLVRDIDVLLDSEVWEQDEENVLLQYDTGFNTSFGPFGDPAPEGWTTNSISDFGLTSSVNEYLWSFDLHVTMEGGTPDTWTEDYLDFPEQFMKDGLWIDSLVRLDKGRMGAWEGVVTVPFVDPEDLYRVNLPADFPWVTVYYKKTKGNRIHQFIFGFQPELGEDIALQIAFDDLQFYSNTRDFKGYYTDDPNAVPSREIISVTPGSASATGFFVSIEDYNREDVLEEARLLAASTFGGDLLFPTAFDGSPDLEAIIKEDFQEDGTFVEIYGVIAQYDSIVGARAN